MKAGTTNRDYARGIARGFAGAIIFSFPLLMTMEMWWIGLYMDRLKLLLFMLTTLVLLVPLSRLVGFERTGSLAEDIIDAIVAFGIGALASAILLALFGIIGPEDAADNIVGKIAVQTVPASLGAILARSQFGAPASEERERAAGYAGQLLVMAVGALFLAFNVAPTEEMLLIAFKMTPWHALALAVISIAMLHAFVYALDFRGQEEMPGERGHATGIVFYSIAGYGLAILITLYVLWTFGRTDGASSGQIAMMTTVLGFPAALGAASARLIV